jgi:predicted transcriptional regulator
MIQNIEELRVVWGEKPHQELKRLGAEAGVPYGTVVRIVKGYTKHPRIDTFQKLADAANRVSTQ